MNNRIGMNAFRGIKVALDTNILSYLLDNTYEELTAFIQELNSYEFVHLECSKFALYELIGIRKLEHYIRLITETSQGVGKQVNYSSVLNYRNKWNAPELPYRSCWQKIKDKVEKELNQISENFDINVADSNIHRDVWQPHQDLVLSSKISKEDSMMIMSYAFPRIGTREEHLIFLTNDEQFHKSYCGKETQSNQNGENPDFDIDSVFEKYEIKKPTAYRINRIGVNFQNKDHINLIKETYSGDDRKEYVKSFLLEHLTQSNKEHYLGFSIPCQAGVEQDNLFCFKLESGELIQNIYLTIVTKDLNIINIPMPLSDFWSHGPIENYPYIPDDTDQSRQISIRLVDADNNPLLEEGQLSEIKDGKNMVFIHPDTFL